MQQIEGFEEKKEQALADSDYTSLFKEAVLGAARTNSVQKHKIPARLVTERLAAEADSLITLASHMACNAVPQLSPKHLRFLGLMAILYVMDTPDYVKAVSGETGIDSDQKTFEKGLSWLSDELSPLLPNRRDEPRGSFSFRGRFLYYVWSVHNRLIRFIELEILNKTKKWELDRTKSDL